MQFKRLWKRKSYDPRWIQIRMPAVEARELYDELDDCLDLEPCEVRLRAGLKKQLDHVTWGGDKAGGEPRFYPTTDDDAGESQFMKGHGQFENVK